MEVHLSPNQEIQLNELALKTGRDTDELLQEAVSRFFAYNEGFQKQVRWGSTRSRGESSLKNRKWMPDLKECSSFEANSLDTCCR